MLLFLSSCSGDAPEPDQYEDELVEDSSIVVPETGGELDALNASAEDFYNEFGEPDTFFMSDYGGRPVLDIFNCSLLDGSYHGDALVAMYGVGLRRTLEQMGYPAETFEQPIARFQQALFGRSVQVEQMDEPISLLAGAIDRERTRVAPQLPQVISEGGCGAGEVPVRLSSRTPNGRVWVMGAFDFLHCKRRLGQGDPYRQENCRWIEADGSRPLYLSGRLAYQIRVGRNRAHAGYTVVTPELEYEDEAQPVTVELP